MAIENGLLGLAGVPAAMRCPDIVGADHRITVTVEIAVGPDDRCPMAGRIIRNLAPSMHIADVRRSKGRGVKVVLFCADHWLRIRVPAETIPIPMISVGDRPILFDRRRIPSIAPARQTEPDAIALEMDRAT